MRKFSFVVLFFSSSFLFADIGITKMVSIPSGTFIRENGDKISVNSFSILNKEIDWNLFYYVRDWAMKNGYEFSSGKGTIELPVQNITWYDAVKWCNAFSEMQNLKPAYYEDKGQKYIYKKGNLDLSVECVDWKSDGYRLPTEAEWEYAYRAGTTSNFYWGNYKREDVTNRDYACFHYWGTMEMDGGPIKGGQKKPNAWGLYDMAGNMEEWVWDRYSVNYEGVTNNNPKGTDNGSLRVLRGGGFNIDSRFTADDRHPNYPNYISCQNGFRIASSSNKGFEFDFEYNYSDDISVKSVFQDPYKKEYLRENSAKAASDRIFSLLNPESEELKEAFDYYNSKDYDKALHSLNIVYSDKLRNSFLMLKEKSSKEAVDIWMRSIRENRFVKWAGTNTDLKSAFDFYGESISSLLLKYLETNDKLWLDSYFNIVNQLALNAKPAWEQLSHNDMGANGSPRDAFYGYIGFDAGHPLRQLATLATLLKKTPKDTYPIPDQVMANVLYFSVFDCLATGLQDDRSNVPNQVWGNAVQIFKMAVLCDNLKDSEFWRKEGEYRLKKVARTVMMDGTDLEPSINYNKHQLELIREINELFEKPYPDWLTELNNRLDYRRYMFASLMTPIGSYPAIGNQSDDLRPRGYVRSYLEEGGLKGLEALVLSILDGKKMDKEPAFTSVAFPYGGYYVQRSGWTKDDLFCFMRSSRDGVGHTHFDNNGLQMMAYGSYLLIDDGPPNYMRKVFMPEYQWNMLPYFDENHVGMLYNTSNVGISGNTQRVHREVLGKPTNGWDTPRDLLFYTSSDIDIMEGDFDGYYESEEPLSDGILDNMYEDCGPDKTGDAIIYNNYLKGKLFERMAGTHNRKVIFMREDKFWIVLDDAQGGYSAVQTWHMPPAHEGTNRKSHVCPGFDKTHVILDDNGFYTVNKERPNLIVRNFSPSDVVYNKYYGDTYPFRGWYSFGIYGERVPAPTVACTWKTEKPMLTVLFPVDKSETAPQIVAKNINSYFEDLSEESVSSFKYTDKNGVSINVVSSKQNVTSDKTIEEVSAKSSFLLVRKAKDKVSGIVLGCESFTYNNKKYKIPSSDFVFRVVDGEFVMDKITSPEKFEWKNIDNETIAPSYSE